MPETRFTVSFLPGHRSGKFPSGTTLRDAALQLGVLIDSTCAGMGRCGQCRVEVKGPASPLTALERELLSPQEINKGVRLSCQAEIRADAVCLVPETSTTTIASILVEGQAEVQEFDPDLQLVKLSLREHRLGETFFEMEHLLQVMAQRGAPVTSYPLSVVQTLPQVLRQGRDVTAVVYRDRLLALESGREAPAVFGVAVDVGTTTLAAKLVDLSEGQVVAVASETNPQRAVGGDVIARVHYLREQNPQNGLKYLHRLVIRAINTLIDRLCEDAGVSPDRIFKLTLVGNTIMQHLALGVDPSALTEKPYTPAVKGPLTVPAAELKLSMHPQGVVYAIANLGCFVGSDITAVLTVLDLERGGAPQLVVDIGTNGEMVLAAGGRIICTSSPAGPAWEGASIEWGTPAVAGAIERARVVDGDVQFTTIARQPAIGICGSGLVDLVCEFRRCGLIDASGRILPPERAVDAPDALRQRLVARESGACDIRIAPAADGRWILLKQKDIREVQLAKAAIRAGIEILLRELQVKPVDLQRVFVAGAFGNHLRGEDAVALGLLPEIPPERIHFIGNAALAGAEAVLTSKVAREKAEHLAQKVAFVEIAEKPEFQDVFVEAMRFPEII
ncbi:MAG: ASKHA domain-containing protein [candidate division KSB1 bacterium]|nr:ASKHA domain-containing protein [candidate division KSB1 bacterium]